MSRECLLGLDLSLRGPAAVVLPLDWCDASGPDWTRVRSWRFDQKGLPKDASEIERSVRNANIAFSLEEAVRGYEPRWVFIENYAFDRRFGGERLAELGGVVKLRLTRLPYVRDIRSVTASAARKLLFGTIKRGSDVKSVVRDGLKRMGASLPTQDEYDALVIANFGLSELGRPALIQVSSASAAWSTCSCSPRAKTAAR